MNTIVREIIEKNIKNLIKEFELEPHRIETEDDARCELYRLLYVGLESEGLPLTYKDGRITRQVFGTEALTTTHRREFDLYFDREEIAIELKFNQWSSSSVKIFDDIEKILQDKETKMGYLVVLTNRWKIKYKSDKTRNQAIENRKKWFLNRAPKYKKVRKSMKAYFIAVDFNLKEKPIKLNWIFKNRLWHEVQV